MSVLSVIIAKVLTALGPVLLIRLPDRSAFWLSYFLVGPYNPLLSAFSFLLRLS